MNQGDSEVKIERLKNRKIIFNYYCSKNGIQTVAVNSDSVTVISEGEVEVKSPKGYIQAYKSGDVVEYKENGNYEFKVLSETANVSCLFGVYAKSARIVNIEDYQGGELFVLGSGEINGKSAVNGIYLEPYSEFEYSGELVAVTWSVG
jgi:hypothetical protein